MRTILRRVSTRFSLSVSLLLLASVVVASQAETARKRQSGSGRANELTLAGLRPGRSTLRQAVKKYGAPRNGGRDTPLWQDDCRGEALSMIDGETDTIQTIRIFDDGATSRPTCEAYGPSPWATGRGLRVGDVASRVEALYGKPDSKGPSTKNGQPLELLYYAFDWAGPDVPQVMEVVCTPEKDGKPGRVVEITLAAPSL